MPGPELPTRLRGLRGRVTAAFVLSASLVAVLLSGSVYAISTNYMESQRVRTVERAVGVHAEILRLRMESLATGQEALESLRLPAGTIALLDTTTGTGVLGADQATVATLERAAEVPSPATRVRIAGEPYLRTATYVENGAVLQEFAPLRELEDTLKMLRTILFACAVLAVAVAAALGAWAAHLALRPLRQVAGTASRIAAGDLDLRLSRPEDVDLSPTVEAFNAMVDSLQRRIERERRLVSDLSHELRTPLTTLTTTATVLAGHRDELSERPRAALGLLVEETTYLRGLLDDMLALARAEAGIHRSDPAPLSLAELLAHLLASRRVVAEVLTATDPGLVRGRRMELERALLNLLVNAERHGGGVAAVRVERDGDDVRVTVDDEGPGVEAADRERIFERFVTASRRTGGTGIGLALVAETVAGHQGRIRCSERPGGGARFELTLPALDRHVIAKKTSEPPQ
ncbi:ATP-binding protein [Nocardia sp. NPDC003979]